MFINIDRDILHLLLGGMIWLVVAGCAISSIHSHPRMDAKSRRFWTIVVLAFPLLGLLAYLPFSLDNPKIFHEWINKLFPGKHT